MTNIDGVVAYNGVNDSPETKTPPPLRVLTQRAGVGYWEEHLTAQEWLDAHYFRGADGLEELLRSGVYTHAGWAYVFTPRMSRFLVRVWKDAPNGAGCLGECVWQECCAPNVGALLRVVVEEEKSRRPLRDVIHRNEERHSCEWLTCKE